MKFVKMLFWALALVVANYACTEKNDEPTQEREAEVTTLAE